MPTDSHYDSLPRPTGALAHHYGDHVHLLSHPWAMTMLAQLCEERTHQPRANDLVRSLYSWMLTEVASRELATRPHQVPTRMATFNPDTGVFGGELIQTDQQAVVVDIARAGILPGICFFDGLNRLLEPGGVRQDHVFMNRATDTEGRVTGVDLHGSKIGGPIENAVVLIPDPMAATGSSTAEVLRMYRDEVEGTPRKMVVVHLIVTPEYLRRITDEHPGTEIYAVRVDRGLSAADVLQTVPGTRWDEEVGLNENQYIVPGGGGFGEVMNNAWV